MTKSTAAQKDTIRVYGKSMKHVRLGRIAFDDALKIQEAAIESYRKKKSDTGTVADRDFPVIFTLEHEPVITCGRSTRTDNLLLTEDEYSRRGIDVRKIDRGGDVTWHGPGQVVVYPIVALREHGLRASEWVSLLEEAMILTCKKWGVGAFRRTGLRGCFTEKGKIGAVGTAVKAGGITKHGIAFNVCPDLENFSLIVPCGITGYPVTRLIDNVESAPGIEEVAGILVSHISNLLGFQPAQD